MRIEKRSLSKALGAAAAAALGLAALPVAGTSVLAVTSAPAAPSEHSGAIVSAHAERATAQGHRADRAEVLRAEISSGGRLWLERLGLSGISAVGFDSDTGETTVRGTEYVLPHAVMEQGLGRVVIGGVPATVVFQSGT